MTSAVKIIKLKECSSTNAFAKELLKNEKPVEGTVILASYQTAGKGQDKNSWESDPGENILMTMILYPDFLEISRQFKLSMAIALGISDFLKNLLPGHMIRIKWPNDIYIGDKKIGGILINNEIMGTQFKHVIAGIGINVNQIYFSREIPNPVSLKLLTGITNHIDKLVLLLSENLLTRYEQLRTEEEHIIIHDYHSRLLGMGEWKEYIHHNKKIRAKITGVNEFGRLMLETDGDLIECDLKEIAYLF